MLDQYEIKHDAQHQSPELPRGGRRFNFPLEFFGDVRLPQEQDDLVRGLLPGGSLVVLYGKPGKGKSFIALNMGLHVAAGRSWAERPTRQAGVIYVAAEGARGLYRRLIAAKRHFQLADDLPFALITRAPDLGRRSDEADRLAAEIKAQLPPGFNPGLIILDTLARTMNGGDESGAAGMNVYIENAQKLGRELNNATVMPIHHMGKDASAGMRGSSALLAGVDAAWEIDPETPGRLQLIKMKDDQDGIALSYWLERIELGQFSNGDAITSCVAHVTPMVPDDKPQTAHQEQPSSVLEEAPRLSETSRLFHDRLCEVIAVAGQTPGSRYKHIPKDVNVVRQADLHRHADVLGVTGSTLKSRRTQIDRHVAALDHAGLVNRHDGWIWPTPACDILTKNEEK